MLTNSLETESHLMEGQLKQLEKSADVLKNGLPSKREKLEKAAKNFENFMMSFMYKQMYKSIPKSNVFGNAQHREVFMGMYMDEVSKQANTNSTGIAQQLIKQYERHLPPDADIDKIAATTQDITKNLTQEIKTIAHKLENETSVAKIYKQFDKMIAKINDKITSHFGIREHPITNKTRLHSGVDLGLQHGSTVNIPAKGKVEFAGEKGGYGKTVIIDHGKGVQSLYAHLSAINVKTGDTVDKNAQIGKVGSTGMSTGPHLHLEVRKNGKPIDPLHLVSE